MNDFDKFMNECGILNFGIPLSVNTHPELCNVRNCNCCYIRFLYNDKKIKESIKFKKLSDRNKEFYLRRYGIFQTKWNKVVSQCDKTTEHPFALILDNEDFGYGYDGIGDGNMEFDDDERVFSVSPFECRKSYVGKALVAMRVYLESTKDAIYDFTH